MRAQERYSDLQAVLRAATSRALGNAWTSLPGYVVDFDPATGTATIQPGVKIEIQKPDGTSEQANLALLSNVPIMFPRGGGVTLTFPIKPGDECLVHFSSRCVDEWKALGGTQPQSHKRFHNLSDGFAVPGTMSQSKALPLPSTTTTQLRSDSGDTYVELDPAGRIVNVVAPGGMSITTPTLTINGKVAATGDVVAGGISLMTHTHSGVESGSSMTGPPEG